ncbi:MAG: GNAT family N-acetyltransferase, partial [gamma proteobacterium symbiont of Phacoides pectinatus]
RGSNGCRVGESILGTGMSQNLSRGSDTLVLNAQLQAIPFYRRHGFRERGGVFLEAGIEHRRMEMPVDD